MELSKGDQELTREIRATQSKLKIHVEALTKLIHFGLNDVLPEGTGFPDGDNLLRLQEHRGLLTKRLERTKKRLEFAISERNLYQTKVQASEEKVESVQSLLEEALQNNVDLNRKVYQLEYQRTRLNLRIMERDEARSLLAEAERLNGILCNDIISLSEELWKSKEANHIALAEKQKAVEASRSATNEGKEEKEAIARELTLTRKTYSDRLSRAEAESRQLKHRVCDTDKQLSEQRAKLDDALKQLAAAQEELAGNSDTERNLARQVGCLREELDTMEAKYSSVLEEMKIAKQEAKDAKEGAHRLRDTSQVGSSDDEESSVIIDDLKERIKALEESNRRLEELKVLGENNTDKV